MAEDGVEIKLRGYCRNATHSLDLVCLAPTRSLTVRDCLVQWTHGGLSSPESASRVYNTSCTRSYLDQNLSRATMNVLNSPGGGVLATYDSSSVDVSVSSPPAQLTARRSGVSSQRAMSGVFHRTRSILNNFVKLRPVRSLIFFYYHSGTYRWVSAR